MILVVAFDILLVTSCAYALLRGDWDSRTIAIICTGASIISHIMLRENVARYSDVEVGVFVIDFLTFVGFTVVALTSSRFWPLWIAGLQLTTLLAHASKEIAIGLVPQAYYAAAVFWSFPILIILAVGTWREHQRRLLDS